MFITEHDSLFDRPYTTLLLRKGQYVFNEPLSTTKSIQVIGIEDGVEFNTGEDFDIKCTPKWLTDDIEPEQTINIHFENKFCFKQSDHGK